MRGGHAAQRPREDRSPLNNRHDTPEAAFRPADGRVPVFVDGRLAGYAGRILDFSGGPDQPPEPVRMSLPPWPGYLAHCRWPGDGAIYLLGGTAYYPDDPVDMRCSACTARPEVALDDPAEMIVFLVHHQPGCMAGDDILALAGALGPASGSITARSSP